MNQPVFNPMVRLRSTLSSVQSNNLNPSDSNWESNLSHYLFFIRDSLPQPSADIVQMVQLANAAGNLGYSSVLTYFQPPESDNSWGEFFFPPSPQPITSELQSYYSLQDRLQILPLSYPSYLSKINPNFFNLSRISSQYYLPFHLKRNVKLVHSRDWNFIKSAVKNGIPAIYERDHSEKKIYEPEIVNNPLFQLTVTVTDTIRDNLIKNGMPPEKIIILHNGCNRYFVERHLEEALTWRQKLLQGEQKYLISYAGALEKFKGIDLLIEIAPHLPDVNFALAGGSPTKITYYQNIINERQIKNVSLVGYLNQKDLAGLLQGSDILVYPHLSGEAADTTSPMKLFDYLAVGKPIVSTKINSLRAFFQGESPSFISAWCDPDDAGAFCTTLQQVLAQSPQWSIDSSQPATIIENYSWESRIKKTLDRVNFNDS